MFKNRGEESVHEKIEAVKEWLNRYLLLMQDADALILRAETLRDRVASPQSPNTDGMPHNSSKDTDRIGNLIALIDDIETEARQKIAEANGIYRELNTTIKRIQGKGSADKRLVLQMKYIDGFKWYDINDVLWLKKTDYTEREESYLRRTFKIHQAALLDIAEILAENGETGNSLKNATERANN